MRVRVRVRSSKIWGACESACETIFKVRMCVRNTLKYIATQHLISEPINCLPQLLEICVNIRQIKTSSKGISNSKCDVGNWKIHMCDIFKILGNFFGLFWEFYGNSLEILWELFGNSWGILGEFLGILGILWEYFLYFIPWYSISSYIFFF